MSGRTMATTRAERISVRLAEQGERPVLVASYPLRRYRFLFSDGSTADVHAARDDSDLRADVLVALGRERIEGVADCGLVDQPAEPGSLFGAET